MYNRHFRLTSAPFRITPDTRWFFGGGQRAEVLETLKYTITSGEGIVKVTGEVGTGKTMLCRMLQDRLPDTVETVYVANPGLDKDEILTAICQELGLQASATPLECQQQLHDYLLKVHRDNRQVVVFVEEAQQMPLDTLEAIRLLSNLETRCHKLLQLVLFGQPELDQLLEKYEIRQLRDRITHSFRLTPLNTTEVRDYIRFRLHNAGYQGDDLFSSLAYRLLAGTCDGLIRRLHIIADKALLAAYADRAPRVTWRHVLRARRDYHLNAGKPRKVLPALGTGLATGLAIAMLVSRFGSPVEPLPLIPEPTQAATIRQSIDSMRAPAAAVARPDIAPNNTSLLEKRLRVSREWLADPDQGQLTIQLLLTDSDDAEILENMLEKPPYRDIVDQLYLVRTRVGGRERWNLLYGEFDTKTKALAALAELPDRIRKHKPYLRSLDGLRPQRTVASVVSEDGQG